MRKWINLIEYADPNDRMTDPFHRGEAHYAPPSLKDRPGFEEWFQGSRVSGPDGPLIAFHGSFERFTEFKLQSENRKAYGFNRLGFWFDIDPRTPEYFAGFGMRTDKQEKRKSEGGVMPCVLSIKKPFHLDSEFIYLPDIQELDRLHKEWLDLVNLRDAETDPLKKENYYTRIRDADKLHNAARSKIIRYQDEDGGGREDGFHRLMKLLPHGGKSTDAQVDAFVNELKAEGHDGIYLGDTAADFPTRGYASTDWWIAFYPNQIKSIFAKSFTDSNNIME